MCPKYISISENREKALDVISVAQAKQYIQEGHFTEGSMAPKIRAAIHFVEQSGKKCIITEAGRLGNSDCGTHIIA